MEDAKRKKAVRGGRGWNVFMNDRLILPDNTNDVTGWSGRKAELPKYHQIYHNFRGLVFLTTKDPFKLPINTAKNAFDREHEIYHYLLNKMVETARPVTNYLSKKYDEPKNKVDENESKLFDIVEKDKLSSKKKIKRLSIDKINKSSSFKAPTVTSKGVKQKMTTIAFEKPKVIVDKVKSYLKVRSNSEVGSQVFDYYVNEEGLKDES